MVFFAPFATSEAFAPFSVLDQFESPVYQPLALSTPIFASPACTPRYCRPRRQRAPVRRSLASPLSPYLPSAYQAVSPRPTMKTRTPKPAFHPTFQPRFDIRETADAYELHGDLAGLDKKDVEIEFIDPQTLAVHGRVQRDYSPTVPNGEEQSGAAEDAPDLEAAAPEDQDTKMDIDAESKTTAALETETRASPTPEPRPQSPSHYRKATVEDSPDEDDRLSITSMTSTRSSSSASAEKRPSDSPSPSKAPKTSRPSSPMAARTLSKSSPASASSAAVVPPKTSTEHANYWASERSIGEFSRTFTFPDRIRQNQVHATLDNGVLSVTIPKVRQDTRRVIIF